MANSQKMSNQFKLLKSGSLVTQSCPTLCYHVDCSTPGFPVLHQLRELAQVTEVSGFKIFIMYHFFVSLTVCLVDLCFKTIGSLRLIFWHHWVDRIPSLHSKFELQSKFFFMQRKIHFSATFYVYVLVPFLQSKCDGKIKEFGTIKKTNLFFNKFIKSFNSHYFW